MKDKELKDIAQDLLDNVESIDKIYHAMQDIADTLPPRHLVIVYAHLLANLLKCIGDDKEEVLFEALLRSVRWLRQRGEYVQKTSTLN